LGLVGGLVDGGPFGSPDDEHIGIARRQSRFGVVTRGPGAEDQHTAASQYLGDPV